VTGAFQPAEASNLLGVLPGADPEPAPAVARAPRRSAE